MKYALLLMFSVVFCGSVSNICLADPIGISDEDINKILKAKDMVRLMVRNPDTLVFHEFQTKVSGNTVTLTFTCKNDFGVPETHTEDIRVN